MTSHKVHLLVLAILLSCCHSQEPIPPAGRSDRTFPGPPLYSINLLDGITSIDELFVFERLVPLETTDASMIGTIFDLQYIEGQWVILDLSSDHGVYRFSDEGYFLGPVGRPGPGPDEYVRANNVQACYDGHIGVFDRGAAKILLYDTEGAFVRSVPMSGRRPLFPSGRFVWDHHDRLHVANVTSFAGDASRHLCLDVSGSEPEPLFGFGQRNHAFDLARQKGSGNFNFTMFGRFGDCIWAGPPLSTRIDVFEMDGRYVGRLGDRIPRDPNTFISEDDYKSLHREKDKRKYLTENVFNKYRNRHFFQVGNLVCVWVGRTMDVYDINGNMLAHSLKQKKLFPQWGFGEMAIQPMPPFNPEEMKVPYLKEAALSSPIKVGDDSNPSLLVYKLNPKVFGSTTHP